MTQSKHKHDCKVHLHNGALTSSQPGKEKDNKRLLQRINKETVEGNGVFFPPAKQDSERSRDGKSVTKQRFRNKSTETPWARLRITCKKQNKHTKRFFFLSSGWTTKWVKDLSQILMSANAKRIKFQPWVYKRLHRKVEKGWYNQPLWRLIFLKFRLACGVLMFKVE